LDNYRKACQLFDAMLLMKEGKMEAVAQDEKETVVEARKTGMQRFLSGFTKFIDKGGLLVFMLAFIAAGIIISYSYSTK
jgi:hypothetical protein